MPHALLKLACGRTVAQKTAIAGALTQALIATAGCTEDDVSVGIEDVDPKQWVEAVYKPDILGKPGTLFKQPGLRPALN